jgi:hypothetical protein
MLRIVLFVLASIGLVGLCREQGSTVITPQNPPKSEWEYTEMLPSGREMKLRFELRSVNGPSFPGPKLIAPCNGPAEEANMKGWSDGAMNQLNFAPDYSVSSTVSSALKVGGDAGDAGREIIRRRQTEVETDMTKMIRVRPVEGSGPRSHEAVYAYSYYRYELYVVVGDPKGGTSSLLSCFYLPGPTPLLDSSRPCGSTPSQTACSVGGIGLEGADGKVAMTPLPAVDRHPTGFIGAVFEPSVAEAVGKTGFMATGVDINTVNISEPTASGPVKWIFLPSGTVLVPSKGGIQSMITVDPLLLTSAEFASLTPESLATKSVAVLCLEIEKNQPDPSVTFTPSRPAEPVYRNLAMLTQKSAIKGPWDQARIWIYADKASLERVNKRLAIGCPPGMYVRSLWEVFVMGGMADKDLANADLFRPEFLGAVSNRKDAGPWLAAVLGAHHQPALLKYLGGGAKEFATLLNSSNPLASDQFVRVMSRLLVDKSVAVRVAMLKFLDAQDGATVKKAIGKPAWDWERHIRGSGVESELGKKLKEKLG